MAARPLETLPAVGDISTNTLTAASNLEATAMQPGHNTEESEHAISNIAKKGKEHQHPFSSMAKKMVTQSTAKGKAPGRGTARTMVTQSAAKGKAHGHGTARNWQQEGKLLTVVLLEHAIPVNNAIAAEAIVTQSAAKGKATGRTASVHSKGNKGGDGNAGANEAWQDEPKKKNSNEPKGGRNEKGENGDKIVKLNKEFVDLKDRCAGYERVIKDLEARCDTHENALEMLQQQIVP
ncbi:hypothetical protein V8E53_013500 [Lactarius tabidus]